MNVSLTYTPLHIKLPKVFTIRYQEKPLWLHTFSKKFLTLSVLPNDPIHLLIQLSVTKSYAFLCLARPYINWSTFSCNFSTQSYQQAIGPLFLGSFICIFFVPLARASLFQDNDTSYQLSLLLKASTSVRDM